MTNLVNKKISDLGNIITGKTPLSSCPEDFGSSFLFVTPPDFSKQKYIHRTERNLSKIGAKKLISKVLPPNSIMVTCIGDIGRVAMNKNMAITNQQINSIVVNTKKFDPHYLYYSLNANRKTFLNNSGRTVVPILNKTEFEKIEIGMYQDKGMQQKIASVLSSLDSKIELNNSMSTELESMAKTLYNYWFVQFDFPNAKGKPYKSSGGKMVWNDKLKKKIPQDWVVYRLGNLLSTSLGGTPSTKNKKFWSNGTNNWLNSGEIANFPIIDSELKITDEAIKYSATQLLPLGTTLLSITRHLRPTILAINACANQSVVGIKEKDDIKCFFIYPYLKNEIPRLMSLRTGAQQPHINKETVDESLIVIPDDSNIFKAYNSKVGHLYQMIINNAFQNKKLSELRDWLLPMLMNGQVKVK